MAITAITSFSNENILLNPGEAGVRVVTGKLYEDMPPATVVIFSYDNSYWVKAVSTTAAHRLSYVGIVGYKKRVNQSTNAIKIITDNWDISEAEDKRAPIITSGFCIANILDQNGTLQVQRALQVSATAGSFTALSQEADGATSGSALLAIPVASCAINVADDDTKTIVGIGAFLGQIWGGYNM